MPITAVLAGVAVADFDDALAWYERLFGRAADRRPMDGLAEWHSPAGGALQVIHDGDRAGRGVVTLSADDLTGVVAGIEARGLAPGAIDDTTSPSLEQLEDPAVSGVPVLGKKLVVDLGKVAGVPGKIEGVARVDHDTLALINDNDFGMTDGAGAFDAQGRLVDSGIETTVTYVRLPHGF